MRSAFAAASLIHKDNPVELGVEKAAVARFRSGAWPPVQKNHRLAAWIAAFFPIEFVSARDLQVPCTVRLDWGVFSSHFLTLYK